MKTSTKFKFARVILCYVVAACLVSYYHLHNIAFLVWGLCVLFPGVLFMRYKEAQAKDAELMDRLFELIEEQKRTNQVPK